MPQDTVCPLETLRMFPRVLFNFHKLHLWMKWGAWLCLSFLCRVGKGASRGPLFEKYHHFFPLFQSEPLADLHSGEIPRHSTLAQDKAKTRHSLLTCGFLQFSGIELTQVCNLLKVSLQIYCMRLGVCLWN